MAFRGWTDEAIAFFEGLELDNSKEYWHAHKADYERAVRAPMEELLEELGAEYGSTKLFRPYRDVRFSKDKTPYKTTISALVGRSGYVSLRAGGLGAGSGRFHMAPDELARYRAAVDDDASGTQLEAIVARLREDGHELIAHGELKTAPKGYPRDHRRIDLLRSKGLTVWREWPPGPWLSTAKAKDRIVGVLRAAEPLDAWLDEHVGDPDTA